MEISEDNWKVVEARLQADIDAGKGDKIGMMFIGEPSSLTGSTKKYLNNQKHKGGIENGIQS